MVAGKRSDSSATHALATGSGSWMSQPSGARSAQTSSNASNPGMLFAAIVRIGPGGHEVHADALAGRGRLRGSATTDSNADLATPIQS